MIFRNKPPVRIYLFGVLSLVEMHLSFWIRNELPDDSWRDMVPKNRLRAATRLQERKRKQGHDTSLLDCLSLGDKKEIARQSPEVLRRLGIDVQKATGFDAAQELRNQLAHAYENLAEGRTWAEISEVVAWAEQMVHQSDAEIEREVAQADGYEDGLWASA